MSLICENLSVSIGATSVCRGLDLAMEGGEVWGLLGRNGSGKTTLLHTLANLLQPQAGRVLLGGTPVQQWPRRKLAQQLGLLTQDAEDPFPTTVLETALIGRHPHTPAWRLESAEDIALAKAALREVALEDLSERQIDTLSGGERQRLALATILTQAPNVFLLDEPTNHLDMHHQVSLLELFSRRAKQKEATVIMSLHDINLAARFCDKLILLLGDGEAVFGPTDAMLSEDYLHRLYHHCIVRVESNGRTAFLPG